MSYIFETVTGSTGDLGFHFNGQFALKNYNVEIVNGNRLKVVSTQNENFSLLEAEISEVEINGMVYSDPSAAQIALTSLVHSSAEPIILMKEQYLQLAAAIQTSDRGKIMPDTPVPSGGWQPGWYTPGLFENEDPGTNYPNQNNLKAKKGFFTKFLFNGSNWDFIEYEFPQASNNITRWEDLTFPETGYLQTIFQASFYELPQGVTAQSTDIPGVSDKWIPLDYLRLGNIVITILYPQLQVGLLLSNGTTQNTSTWRRTDFIPLELNDSISYNLQTVSGNSAIFLYDVNKVFLRSLLPNTLAHQIFTGTWVNTFSDAKFIRVHTLDNTHPNYQALTFNLTITRKSDFIKLKENVESNNTKFTQFDPLIDQTKTFPYANLESGLVLNTGANQASTQWRRSDYIAIKKNDIVNYTVQTIQPNNTLFLYDANKVFLRALFPNTSAGWQLMTGSWINTYDDAKFVRVHTLSETHPNYQVIAYNLNVINKGDVPNLQNSTTINATDIAALKQVDLEMKLADLLISRDEQIAKIEAGDYGVIVNGNDFVTGTQTERLKDAIAFIKKMGKGVLELTKDTITDSFVWSMSEALTMPSNFTLLIRDGVTLRKQDGIFDNLLRNDGIVPNPAAPYGRVSALNKNENIHIILEDTAYINDLDVPKNAPHPITGGTPVDWHRDYFGWRGITLLFANCKNYCVKGGNFNKGRMWMISNESGCENFVYDAIDFRTAISNGDGIDMRMGCKNFIIKNITGVVVDDLVAMTCLNNSYELDLPMQAGGQFYRQNDTYQPTIENGIIYNIEGMSVNHLCIVLVSGTGTKINNIRIGKLNQVPSIAPTMSPINSVLEVFTGYYQPYSSMGAMTNIYVNDVTNRKSPWGALRLDVPIKDSHFNKLNSISTIPTVSYSSHYVAGDNVFLTNVKQDATP
ncbi:glycoside hydrolase family protein [Chryseobacterium terrae]|uniref:Uncharacterized protein n=1 Tax=Chryseobacterium terrae TaxID=3163299 RepID=A0ABW8Y4Y3_9FLAO